MAPRRALIAISITVTGACAAPSEQVDGELCEIGKCDDLPFLQQLNGREDPISKHLRSLAESGAIDSSGKFRATTTKTPEFYDRLLGGLATIQCGNPKAITNFALSDDLLGPIFPRLVSTVCVDTDKAGDAFVATLARQDKITKDLSLDDLEMFAWDPTAAKYSFYASSEESPGELKIEVDPARCSECHLTPRDVDPIGMNRIPIMNELTKPWTHWNAGTGGVSDSFIVPAELKGKPNWEKYGVAAVAAASRFEKVIRDANATRVAPTRSKQMFKPTDLNTAMGLIRPLFCDEQLNYLSESPQTGELSVDAVVSGGIKAALRSIQPHWPWPWFNNDNIQLPATTDAKRVFMMPVRGVAEVTYEALVQTVLSPTQILAARALDWKKPAFSKFRCDLWKNARKTFQTAPPALTGRNRDAVKVLYDAIMKNGGMTTAGIASGKFVAVAEATPAAIKALKDAVASNAVPTSCGTAAFCELDAAGFGGLIDAHVSSFANAANRETLLAERNRRVCEVLAEVDPVGDHSQHGVGPRIANRPSFLRVAPGGVSESTLPPLCAP